MSNLVPAVKPRFLERLNRCPWVAGAALIALGLLMLAGEVVRARPVSLLLPAAFGAVFIAWGIIIRRPGLIVPGGVFFGLGLGLFLSATVAPGLGGEASAGLLLLGLAFGIGMIAPLSLLTCRTLWWALLPASALTSIGWLMLVGGPAEEASRAIDQVWPVALIAIGAYLLLRYRTEG